MKCLYVKLYVVWLVKTKQFFYTNLFRQCFCVHLGPIKSIWPTLQFANEITRRRINMDFLEREKKRDAHTECMKILKFSNLNVFSRWQNNFWNPPQQVRLFGNLHKTECTMTIELFSYETTGVAVGVVGLFILPSYKQTDTQNRKYTGRLDIALDLTSCVCFHGITAVAVSRINDVYYDKTFDSTDDEHAHARTHTQKLNANSNCTCTHIHTHTFELLYIYSHSCT